VNVHVAKLRERLEVSDTIPRQRADRRQLQQIIAGLSEGVILIDPDQTIFWANEAALAMHGATKLEDLGATVTEYREQFELRYRNRHRLSNGEYPMDRVLDGEAFRDVTVEVAKTGDDQPRWVHEIRSIVLTDTAGDPDCLVLVMHDVTERYSAEERFEKAFAANPAPAIICRLSDLRFVKVNQGFLEMTGYARDDVVERSAYEIDVLAQAENKELAIERLNEGRTIPQMEAALSLPRGQSKSVIVAGQPIEIGDEACMLFTFMDLEPRKKAEAALRESEERFAKAFRLAPVPMTVSTGQELRILDVNDAFLAATGYAAEEVIGRTAAELGLWEHPTDRKRFEQMLEKAGHVRSEEVPLRTKEGHTIDCLMSAETVTIQDQPCVLGVMQDISERKRSEEELAVAIETVMQDTSWFSRTVLEKLATLRQPRGTNIPTAELADLTPRERDVLGLMCRGNGDEEIASELKLSRNTVRNHVAIIYSKIGVHRRSAAIVWARDRGFTGGGSKKSKMVKTRGNRTR
jgi:PAS domain S-box-containing protein